MKHATSRLSTLARAALFAALLGAPLALGTAGFATPAHAEKPQMSAHAPDSFADLAEKLLPSVVNISTTETFDPGAEPPMPDMPQFPPGSPFEQFFDEFYNHRQGQQAPARRATSLGSGFVIDAKNGYVVTNNHVVPDGDKVEVKVILHNDKTIDAEVVGRDTKTDLCLLKVDDTSDLVATDWGDSTKMRVGDWVIAIGNPFGLGGTVTAGIISARQRNINAGPYDDFIQTDASINKGNSGGPMFNLEGKVIGINTAIFSPSGGSVGIGFAIPSDLAQKVVTQLIKYGQTRRGWIGVRIQLVTDEIAESLDLKEAKGALVASITPGGPSAKTDLEAGDVILSFNGHDIHEMRELPRVVAETEIGTEANMKVWHDGKIKDVKIKVGELEAAEEEGLVTAGQGGDEVPSVTLEPFGLKLTDISPDVREQFGLRESTTGVLVLEVNPTSIAADKDIRPGDVISEVEHDSVTSAKQVEDKVKKAREAGQKSLLIRVVRHGNPHFVVLKFPQ